jgi:hypothetical protein
MAGEEESWETFVQLLFQTNWKGVVVACLSPLTLDDVDQGIQLIRIVPWDERTTFQQRFRTAVNKKFQEHSIGIQSTVNITRVRTSPQRVYEGDLVIDAGSRSEVRELFVRYLKRASDIYRDRGEAQKQAEAENLVVAIENL